jgi:hypothetical protein
VELAEADPWSIYPMRLAASGARSVAVVVPSRAARPLEQYARARPCLVVALADEMAG